MQALVFRGKQHIFAEGPFSLLSRLSSDFHFLLFTEINASSG